MTDDAPRSAEAAGTGAGRPAARAQVGRPGVRTAALGVAVVLGTLLVVWGADRLGRWGAENLMAGILQDATGASARPSVEVHGGFVLPQVLRGRYDDVTVTLPDLRSGPLHVDEVRAELSDVRLSFHDVLHQERGDLYAGAATQRATLGYADLDRYLDATGRPLTAAPSGQDDAVQLSGTVPVLGSTVVASATAQLVPQGGELGFRPTEVATDAVLDPTASALLRQRFSFAVPLDVLPFGREVSAVTVGEDGLVLRTRDDGVLVRR